LQNKPRSSPSLQRSTDRGQRTSATAQRGGQGVSPSKAGDLTIQQTKQHHGQT
jgi:hypothetical protein